MITRAAKIHQMKVSRRAMTLGWLKGALALGLVGRLYYLQIEEGRQYTRLSDLNKYNFRILPPSRGRIYDDKGRLLAGNTEVYELNITPAYVDGLEKTLFRLMHLIELTEEEYLETLADAGRQPDFLPVQIRTDLSHREVARVVIRSPELPGVNFQRVEKRIYPQGILSGHLTGYINKATADEVANGVITPELQNLNTGKSGVEKAFETSLRGRPGRERILVNAVGRPMKTAIDEEPRSGGDVQLNINIDHQLFALDSLRTGRNKPLQLASPRVQSELQTNEELSRILADGQSSAYEDAQGRVVPPETGALIAMDIQTGAVKTLISSPAFDPNLFSGRLSNKDWNMLTNNPRKPLLNRPVAGLYSPGSTYKMVVALAALEAGVINEETRFHCPGYKAIGKQNFHCWLKDGHGTMDIFKALERSCDVFFYEIGLKTGIDKISAMARKLGLGEPTGIRMPGEKEGLIPTKAWKKNRTGKSWTIGETVNASIGQGYVLTTPLQLAVMTARIANGKKAVTPKLTVDELSLYDEIGFNGLNISDSALEIVQTGMRLVMNGSHGTARKHDLTDKGIPIAGKTGTVQVRAISKEERERGIVNNADRLWKFRDHALFVCYAPYENPRYAVCVVVEHGGSGSATAAPIAKKMVDHLFQAEAI